MFNKHSQKIKVLMLTLALIVAVSAVTTTPASAQGPLTRKTFTIMADDLPTVVNLMKLKLNIAGAMVRIAPTTRAGVVLEATVSYVGLMPAPYLASITKEGVYTIDIKGAGSLWTIYLGNQFVLTDVILNAAGLVGTIDLGGLHLRNIKINMTGTALDFDFSSPTTYRVNSIKVNSSGARFTMKNIGNTDFKLFQMYDFTVDALLDFRGTYVNRIHRVDIFGVQHMLKIVVPMSNTLGEKINILYPAPVSMLTIGDVYGDNWRWGIYPFNAIYKELDYDEKDQKLDITVKTHAAFINIQQD